MMYLDNPRSAERDNQNAMRKYPFADSSECGNGNVEIPPGAVIDAQLYVPGREAGRVWMSLVDGDGRLHFSDADGEFAVTSAAATPLSAVPVTFTGDGGPLPGGVVVFGREEAVAALVRSGGQQFSAEQAELAPAAVTFTGARGVTGFRLDDGNVVWGRVRFRGANGCDVATYVTADGRHRLRISAVGAAAADVSTTGFVKRVVADSDNSNFTVGPLLDGDGNQVGPNRCVFIAPDGANHISTYSAGGAPVPYDQADACADVRKARGTLPSASAAAADCDVCSRSELRTHVITFKDGSATVGAIRAAEGEPLPPTRTPSGEGRRFAGYFTLEEGGEYRRRYLPDGTGTGRYSWTEDVTMYAMWIAASSRAEASFDGYGTLHLAAAEAADYDNPLRISGRDGGASPVRTMTADELKAGGPEALADLVLHPASASGEVVLSLRGMRKASDT